MKRGDFPYVPMEECIKGRVYKLWCRNLSIGVYDGKQGFIGIRTKFGSRFLDTEYHWDQGSPFGTVRGQEDLGIDVPEGIELKTYLGSKDLNNGRPIRYTGGEGWVFVDTSEPCPLNDRGYQDVKPCAIINKDLFRFMENMGEHIDETK